MNTTHHSLYKFTNEWFVQSRPIWASLLTQFRPERILEVGSFEGQSICFCIDYLSQFQKQLDIVCIDTWDDDFYPNMSEVYQQFKANTKIAINHSAAEVQFRVCRQLSLQALASIIADQENQDKDEHPTEYDLVYIDGSHYAKDVLTDAVLAFSLLKVGGLMIFDDYLWTNPSSSDGLSTPKMAIDAFTTIFRDRIQFISAPLYQIYLVKTAI